MFPYKPAKQHPFLILLTLLATTYCGPAYLYTASPMSHDMFTVATNPNTSRSPSIFTSSVKFYNKNK